MLLRHDLAKEKRTFYLEPKVNGRDYFEQPKIKGWGPSCFGHGFDSRRFSELMMLLSFIDSAA